MKTYVLLLLGLLSISAFSQPYSIDGRIKYKRTLGPLYFKDSCYIALSQSGNVIAQDTVGNDGYYHFNNLSAGIYEITVTSNKLLVGVGGGTDALLIMRHFVGMAPLLSGLNLLAADVSGDHFPNAIDALFCERRYVQAINSFPTGDWIFENPTVEIIGSSVTQDIFGLCHGDVNGSGQPINTGF